MELRTAAFVLVGCDDDMQISKLGICGMQPFLTQHLLIQQLFAKGLSWPYS